MEALVAAVDVGTGSARAALFDARGALLGRAVAAFELHRPAPGRGEHDSEEIWRAAAAALGQARAQAGAPAAAVRGLAFDATCSLVLRDGAGRPLPVSEAAPDRWDTIAWLDHRALVEAEVCTATGHRAVARSGGRMSPEMQIPKLMWVKRRLPARWRRLGAAFDLADFLAWRATGTAARSHCTLACKWGYLGPGPPGWPDDFLAAVGLEDLRARAALPATATPVGAPVGRLAPAAAAELGLAPGCPVAAGLVDAHAGALGALGGAGEGAAALIAGTSSCVMAFGPAPREVPGLWGPYHDVALPGRWMAEGGQSASGALIDHLCARWAGRAADAALHAAVWRRIAALRAEEGPDLAPRLHVLPDFHGNRTPAGDAVALGVISGLDLDGSFDGLCRLVWRTAVALALGLRQVVETLEAGGWPVGELYLAGGHGQNPLLAQLYADATGRRLRLPAAPDPVALGAAMAAAVAAGLHPDLDAAARAMAGPARALAPDPAAAPGLARDYAVFRALQAQRREVDRLVAAAALSAPAAGRDARGRAGRGRGRSSA